MGEGRTMQEQLSRATHGAVAEIKVFRFVQRVHALHPFGGWREKPLHAVFCRELRSELLYRGEVLGESGRF